MTQWKFEVATIKVFLTYGENFRFLIISDLWTVEEKSLSLMTKTLSMVRR